MAVQLNQSGAPVRDALTALAGGNRLSATALRNLIPQIVDVRTAALFTSENPVLPAGKIGYTSDTHVIKVGDGSTAWESLPGISGTDGVDFDDLEGVPDPITALAGLTVAAGQIARFTGTNTAEAISFTEAVDDRVAALLTAGAGVTLTYNDGAGTLTIDVSGGVDRRTAATFTSANPILAAGVTGFETDTRLSKVGDGTTAWTSLNYNSLALAELTARLAAGQTAGGIDYTDLAGILAGYVGDGGIPSEVADHEQIWSGEEGTWLLLPEYLRTAFDAVAMTVTAGTPDTISLDFNAGFVRTVAMVDDTDLFSLNNQSGVPRLIVAAATSGDWLFTASAISAKVGWTSTNGVFVRSGERAFFVVRRVGATDYITYLGQTGNEDAPVTLSVSGGNLALDFARCPFVGVASAAGNVAFTTPSNDSGDTHPHTVLLTVTGAPRDVTAPGYTPVNFGDADTVTLPAGATGTFVFWRIGATKFCFYGGRTYP